MQVKTNVKNHKPSKFRNQAPPGVKVLAPKPKADVTDAVELKFSESGPETEGLSFFQKAVAGTMAGVAGFMALAPQAQAAPIEQLVTQDVSQTDGLEVTVLPPGLARVDILRQTKPSALHRSGGRQRERKESYSDVGVHLGRGIFHDANGNLSLIPSMAAGWEDGITDFKRVELDIPGYNESVTSYGNTVHHKESSYKRNVYVAQKNRMEVHTKGDMTQYEVLQNGVQFRGEDGLQWRITENGNVLNVDGPDDNDTTVSYGSNFIELQGKKTQNTVVTSDTHIDVTGSGKDYQMSRSAGGEVTHINNLSITKVGNLIRVQGKRSSLTVNPDTFMQKQEINFGELQRLIEEAEPGYAEKHPLVMGVLEYATANPGLVGEQDAENNQNLLKVGKGIATSGGALQSGQALMKGATALSLAENAKALGANALAAQAAAQSAAQAGNLTQAAALGAEAQNLAGQARALGGEAMKLGDSAMQTAKVAEVMTGVAGALQVIDGGMDLHRGASNKSIVEGAIVITEALKEQLSEEQSGAELEQTMEDYTKVMKILREVKANANKEMRIGGIKIGCGGLMLISALAGGAVIPPIIGAVGMACTAGVSAYEHWDELEAFFKGEEVEQDPTLKEVLPESLQNEILFRLD